VDKKIVKFVDERRKGTWLALYMVVVAAYILSLCSAADAWHWTPPTATNYWETLWGYLTGFTTLDAGDEVAAFRVSDDDIAGISAITYDPVMGYMYSLSAYGDNTAPFDVYFLVWDGSTEFNTTPGFTVHPAYDPGSGPTQRDLGNNGSIPEPPTILILCLSVFLVMLFLHRQNVPSAVSAKA